MSTPLESKGFFQKLFCVYDKPHHLVLIDNREDPSGFCDYVIQYWFDHYWEVDWEIEFANLEIGDAQISDECVFEIKRITNTWNPQSQSNANDFISSVYDGRYWNQTEERWINFKRCIVIIQIEEGAKIFNQHFGEAAYNRIMRESILDYDQHFEYAKTHADVFEIILSFLDASVRRKDHHDPTNKKKKEQDLYDKQIYLLSSIDDCSKMKAEILLDEFGTPLNVIGHIIGTEITYTKTGNIKGTTSNIDGFGPQFFLKNKPIFIQKAIKPIRK
jgi:ERCC4-type nuclease